jgi:Holliday junction resolvase RusA-like endonuclease
LGRGGRVYTPAKTRDYENDVAWAAKAAMGRREMLTGPVELTIVCKFISKDKGWHTSKPDWDNVGKGCCDALNGIVFKDDAQVCSAKVSKINSFCEEVEVTVNPLI